MNVTEGKKLLIFDADSTLFDSDFSIYNCWLIIAKFYNRELFKDFDHFIDISSKYHSNWQHYAVVELGFKESDFDQIMKIWLNEVQPMYQSHTKWYDNMVYILHELKNRGYIIAIATNNSKVLFDKLLKDEGFYELPIHDQISHKNVQKPEPNMIVDHMNNLGFSSYNTVVIGDSLVDLKAARSAEVISVWASYGSSLTELEYEGYYDYILKNPKCLLNIFN
jgi:phosphoglycolate phosphatase